MLHRLPRGPANEKAEVPVARLAAAHPPMLEAEKVDASPAFTQVHDPRLGLLRLKAELSQHGPKSAQGVLGFALGPAPHHETVGVADEHSWARRLPGPVKPVEVDVGQQ